MDPFTGLVGQLSGTVGPVPSVATTATEGQLLAAYLNQDILLTLESLFPGGARFQTEGGAFFTATGNLTYPPGTQLRVRVQPGEGAGVRLVPLEATPPAPPAILAPLLQGEAGLLLGRILQAEEGGPLQILRQLAEPFVSPSPTAPAEAGVQGSRSGAPAPGGGADASPQVLPRAPGEPLPVPSESRGTSAGAGVPLDPGMQGLRARGGASVGAEPVLTRDGMVSLAKLVLQMEAGSGSSPVTRLPGGEPGTAVRPSDPPRSVAPPALLPSGPQVLGEAVEGRAPLLSGEVSGAVSSALPGVEPEDPRAQLKAALGMPGEASAGALALRLAPLVKAFEAFEAGRRGPWDRVLAQALGLGQPGPEGAPLSRASEALRWAQAQVREAAVSPSPVTDEGGVRGARAPILGEAMLEALERVVMSAGTGLRKPGSPAPATPTEVQFWRAVLRRMDPGMPPPAGALARFRQWLDASPSLDGGRRAELEAAAREVLKELPQPGRPREMRPDPEAPGLWRTWTEVGAKALADPAISPREAPFHALQALEHSAFLELPLPWVGSQPLQLWVEWEGDNARPGGRQDVESRLVFEVAFSRLGRTRAGVVSRPEGLRVRLWLEDPARSGLDMEALKRELLEGGRPVDLQVLTFPEGAPGLRDLAMSRGWEALG